MKRSQSNQFGQILKRAVLCAALFIAGGVVQAQTITLKSEGGGLSLSGRFINFDGEIIQIDSDYGILAMRLGQLICEGEACPTADNFLPTLRLSGASRMSDVLMPALVEGFARAQGFQTESIDLDTGQLRQTLLQDGVPVAAFHFRATNTDNGFADLFAREADIVMAVREVRPTEVTSGQDAGLGRLDEARQSRIIALDALVPVIAPQNDLPVISLSQLASIFSGDVTNWSAIGGEKRAIKPFLGSPEDGMTQRFVDGVLGISDTPMSANVDQGLAADEIALAIASTPGAVSILPYRDIGNGRAIALGDKCGFISAPNVLTLKTEDYPLTAPLFLYFPKWRLPEFGREFLAWLRSPEAQLIVRRAGFVDQGPVPIPLDAQGQRFANAIAAAGSDMPLSELQRMVRVLGQYVRLSTSFRFEVGSNRLDAQSRSNLFNLAQAISDGRYQDRRLLLVGFSDGRGGAAANRSLSADRSETVLRNLEQVIGGALPDGVLVETEAFGEALPLGCDDTEWGRQMNRRVELWVSQ